MPACVPLRVVVKLRTVGVKLRLVVEVFAAVSMNAVLPENKPERLDALRRYDILDGSGFVRFEFSRSPRSALKLPAR
jgi:hypothetical protein